MGADNSTLSRLCGPQQQSDIHSEVQSEISQQHQRSRTENYDEVEDSSSEGNIYDNVHDDEVENNNNNNNNNDNNNAETGDQKYDNQALLVLMERELESTKDEHKRVVNKYDIKLSEIESELREVKQNLKMQLEHKTLIANKLKGLTEEYEKLKNTQSLENDEQINEYKLAVEKIQQEFDEYSEQKTTEIEEYETEIDNYKQNISDLDEQITKQKDETSKINQKNEELQNKINKILNQQMEQAQNYTNDNNNQTQNNINSVYNQKIEILENKINELNEYKQSQTDEINTKTDEITRLKAEINEYKQSQNEINTKLEEIKTLKAEIIELKNTIAVKQETIDTLKSKLQNTHQGNGIQSTYINENKQDNNNNNNDELKSDNNKLQKQNEILETIKTEHEQCKTIIAQLKTDNESKLENEKKTQQEILKLKQEIEYYKNQINNGSDNDIQPPPPQQPPPQQQQLLNVNSDVYAITFDRKPFGITFGNTKDKKNLIVNKIDRNSIAYEKNVIAKSKIIQLENEKVEDLGAKYTFKMFKGKFGNQLPLTITFRKPIDYNSDNYTSLSDYNSDDNKTQQTQIQIIKPQIQLISDEKYDINTEVTHVAEWLKIDSSNKQKVKQLKEQLISLLTTRTIIYKQELLNKYAIEYNKSINKDIKLIIGNCLVVDIINGLLMTYAQYDAILIIDYMKQNDFESIADIICCRNIKQLNELNAAYKKEKKLEIKQQLKALAQNDKKKTLVKVIENIFDLDRTDDDGVVDMENISNDLTFIFSAKKVKDDTKERLAVILTANSVQYIRKLNEQFMLKSKDNLAKYVDKKLGNKSTVGYYCKQRILYALNSSNYYALKIRKFGTQFKKNQKQIIHIFIGRMEIDLNEISKAWSNNKYGGNKDLKKWISSKTSSYYDAYYLEKIMDNCSRYAS